MLYVQKVLQRKFKYILTLYGLLIIDFIEHEHHE